MSGKTLARSVQVQDEAAIFQQKLDHQLLCLEQETMLYGYHPEETWRPGDPIRTHPDHILIYGPPGNEESEYWSGRWGNHVRPMIQEIDESWSYTPMDCRDCEVSGEPNATECWMCGAERPIAPPKKPVISAETYGRWSSAVLAQEVVLSRQFSVAMRAAQESFRTYANGMHRFIELLDITSMHPLIDNFTFSNGWYNANRDFFSFRDELAYVEPYTPPVRQTSPFEKRQEPIEFVRPVAADLSVPVEGSVHIPEDVDLSGRMIPELPRRIERTHPDVLHWNGRSLYPVELITEQRRRRNG